MQIGIWEWELGICPLLIIKNWSFTADLIVGDFAQNDWNLFRSTGIAPGWFAFCQRGDLKLHNLVFNSDGWWPASLRAGYYVPTCRIHGECYKIPWLVVSSTENRMLFKLSAGGSALKKHADYGHQRNESHVGVEEKGQSDQLIGW
jgi:hypothetical protein